MIKLQKSPSGYTVSNHVLSFSAEAEELIFQGTYTFVREKGADIYQTLPTGHCQRFPVRFDKNEIISCDADSRVWLADPLHEAFISDGIEVDIEIQKVEEATEVIIINCLDYAYGHSLLKLCNLHRHNKSNPELKAVLIVPQSLAHLNPPGVAEKWIVKTSQSSLRMRLINFDSFVKEQLARFSEIYISMTPTDLDLSNLDVESLFGVKQFGFNRFKETPYQVAFVLREDRLWLTSGWLNWLYLVERKLGLKLLLNYLVRVQASNYRKLARILSRQMPDIKIVITGIGKYASFGNLPDKRSAHPISEEREGEWLQVYANSHIVIGVHGSNMMLPSLLAGACISLLPDFKIPNFAEDQITRYTEDYRQAYFQRSISTRNTPRQVAEHIYWLLRRSWHGDERPG